MQVTHSLSLLLRTSQFLMILVSVSALLLPFRKLEKCDRRVE